MSPALVEGLWALWVGDAEPETDGFGFKSQLATFGGITL